MSKLHFITYKEKFSGVTKDGHQMFIADIVNELNRKSFLENYKLEADAKIAELEKERDALEESHKDLIWFTRDEIKGLDPEQTGFIDLRVMKLEQKAKGIEDAVTKLERPDVPLAPSLILNDDLLDYAARLRNQAAKLKEQE